MKRNKVLTLNKKIALLLTLCFAVLATAQGFSVNRYCVTWNSASGNPSGKGVVTGHYANRRWVEKPAISSEVKHKLIVKK